MQKAETYLGMCEAIGAPAGPAAKPFFARYLEGFEPLGLAVTGAESDDDRHLERLTRALDAALTTALSDMADRCGGTLPNLVQAAWGLMLARWQNAADVVFGVTSNGRNLLDDADRAAGCFLNSLPLRMKVDRDTTLGEAIRTLGRDTDAMHQFEQVSVAQIRDFCNIHGASYLFDTVVMFDRGSMKELFKRAGARSEGRSADLRSEIDLPLSLAVYTDVAMRLELEADPAVVSRDRAGQMLDHLIRLLASIAAAGPEVRLRDLDMLGDDRAELLALGTPEQTTEYVGFLDKLREVVERDPEAIAIQSAGQAGSLSFGALDAASDRLAAVLQAKGAGPGDIVAIHLGRCREYFVSLLAVLKTGAAFLPIDPSYPDAVIEHMVRDSGTRLIISTDMEAPAPGIDVVSPEAETAGEDLRSVERDPALPAYVIYTSGSTGKPKGVVIPDRAMVGHIQSTTRQLGLGSSDRIYQFMSLSFDFSLEEILPTLLNGATLVLRSEAAAQSAAALLDEIAPLGLTVLNLPTAFFHMLTDYLTATGATLPQSLRIVDIGGERANPQIVQDWLNAVPGVRLLNGYGPTETAITATYYELEGEVALGRSADRDGGGPCDLLRRRPRWQPVAARRDRRIVDRRRGRRHRLSRSAGKDRGRVPRRPFPGTRPGLPHRRPRELARRWQPRLLRPQRPPGETARLSHRPRPCRTGAGKR